MFFGSEGGRGVLTATPERFAQALAHGVMFEEYPGFGSDGEPDPPSVLTKENWMLTADDPEEAAEAQEALAHYREDAGARFGAIPPLGQLTAGLEDLNAEFIGWMERVLG